MPPRILSKKQEKAFNTENIEDNLPGIPSFSEAMQNIRSGLGLPEKRGDGSLDRGVRTREIDAMDRDAALTANPYGYSEKQIRELQAAEKAKLAEEARKQVLQRMAAQEQRQAQQDIMSPPLKVEPDAVEEQQISPEEKTILDRAMQAKPELANPVNKQRFLNLIRRQK